MPAVGRAANRCLMSQARQEVRVHSRWEIVGPAEKQRQTVGTILTVMYVIYYVCWWRPLPRSGVVVR
jgi:type II secretory pathway component PulM